MSRLLVNPGTPQAWDIPLKHGSNYIGRGEQNDFTIDHPSVSTAHCEIVISSAGTLVKDLGSTNGTFINRAPVHEALLLSGQHLQLGLIDTIFEADAPVPTPPSLASSRTAFCKFHRKAPARYRCPKCHLTFCDLCVNSRAGSDDATRMFCRTCSTECAQVRAPIQRTQPPGGFLPQLPGAFTYPFHGNGIILLVAATVFLLFLNLTGSLAGMLGPYGGVLALVIGIFGAGYMFSYAKRIITSSAEGEAGPPDWPDFSDWREDILMPFGQMLALLALTFGPALILRWWHPWSDTYAGALIFGATALGALLAPMGLLTLAMFDSVGALNPIALVWSILRIPLHYLLAAAVFELVVGACFATASLAGSLGSIPVLPGVLSGFLNLYLFAVGTRILGLLYAAERDKLGWFNRH